MFPCAPPSKSFLFGFEQLEKNTIIGETRENNFLSKIFSNNLQHGLPVTYKAVAELMEKSSEGKIVYYYHHCIVDPS